MKCVSIPLVKFSNYKSISISDALLNINIDYDVYAYKKKYHIEKVEVAFLKRGQIVIAGTRNGG